jgi:ElaB/YqjD/DUF883 family membrane-anchored ribosome-binding protein
MARSPETADLAAQLDALRADVRALAETLAQMGDSTSQSLRATLEQSFADLKAKGSATVAETEAKLEGTLDDAATYARQKPLQALGIAAGLGMVLGLLLGRR